VKSLSTGVYGYPIAQAAPVAIAAVREVITHGSGPLREVIFCCFSSPDFAVYERLLI
jgi:O-acetyl-ADP-ribose deacetylase (regulator of RNase III)